MRTLWTYGCSWTYSTIHDDRIKLRFWPDIVARNLNIDKVINRADGGMSIGEAATQLMKDMRHIRKDDIVIFQFSYPERQCYLDFERDELWCGAEFRDQNMKVVEFNKKQLTYLDFVLLFRQELTIREFLNVEPIFDYIESNIGALVRYWFLSIEPPEPNKLNVKLIEDTLWCDGRTVSFPPERKERVGYRNNFKHYIEAEPMITHGRLRICDNVKKTSWEVYKKIENANVDGHPDQRGQDIIARNILHSIDHTIKINHDPTIDKNLYGIERGKKTIF